MRLLYECSVTVDTTRILHYITRCEMSVVWCSVSVVSMPILHGYKMLIISKIQRFSVVCNSFRDFCVCCDTLISKARFRRQV